MSSPRLPAVWSPRVSAAAWSKYASCSYRAPPERDNAAFIAELLRVGEMHPGQVLLATSDETAWMYTVNAAALSRCFHLVEPPLRTMQRILDKHQFGLAALAAGVRVAPSWEARSQADLVALAPKLPYPILIKPRTHVNRIRNDKGVLVASPRELLADYPRFLARERGATANPLMPDAPVPILQQYIRLAAEGVCSVTGYIDRSGELFVTRRSTKILQRTQPVGVGLCFESLPPDQGLSDSVRRLCRELGYFGMFEVEFLYCDGAWAVIDFNPRTFNQIGMDVHRGMPLAYFACLEALGDHGALRTAISASQDPGADRPDTVFCDRFTLQAMLFARVLTRRISRDELTRWRQWLRCHASHCVDVAAASGDPLPRIVHVLSEILLGLRAFRRFLRVTPRTDHARAPARGVVL